MKKTKIICPKCGSEDVFGWEEVIVERRYTLRKIRRNNTFLKTDKKPFATRVVGHTANFGYQCNNCGESCNENTDYAEEWIKKVGSKDD